MSYELTDYKGEKLIVTNEQAEKIAGIAELIEVNVGGRRHYINPKNIASINPSSLPNDLLSTNKQIDAPDHRGVDSPAKEKLRKQMAQLSKDKSL
jgi:hypothetical protein